MQAPPTRVIAKVFFTVVAFAAALYFAYLIGDILKLLFVSLFLALALGPAVDFLQRRLRIPRPGAILSTYVLLFVVFFGIALLIVPTTINQADSLVRNLPEYIEQVRENDRFREYDNKYGITDKLKDQADELPSRLPDAANAVQGVTVGIFTAAVQLISVLTVVFFLLLDGGRLIAALKRIMGPERAERFDVISNDIYRSVSGYVVGKLLMSLVAGVISYVTMLILGVPFAVPLAIFMAFISLIPMVGATIGAILIGLVTLLNDFPTDTIIWIVVTVIYQQLENSVLQPVIFKKTVDVHPLMVVVSILIGASLLGILGALVAIPVAAAGQIVVRDWWYFRQKRLGLIPVEPEPEPAEGSA